MARYVQEYRLTESPSENYFRIYTYLKKKGYTAAREKNQSVFVRGVEMTGKTVVFPNYIDGILRLEAWLATVSLGNNPPMELGVEGFVGIAAKGELKRVVVELDYLLGGKETRIGMNRFLRSKNVDSFGSAREQVRLNIASDGAYQPPRPVGGKTEYKPGYEPAPEKPADKPVREPVRETHQPKPEPKAEPRETRAVLDINTCTREELMTLPGLSVAQASRAMTYRWENGGFRSVDEFIDVLKIKPHFAVQILPRITVSRPEEPRREEDAEPVTRRAFDI